MKMKIEKKNKKKTTTIFLDVSSLSMLLPKCARWLPFCSRTNEKEVIGHQSYIYLCIWVAFHNSTYSNTLQSKRILLPCLCLSGQTQAWPSLLTLTPYGQASHSVTCFLSNTHNESHCSSMGSYWIQFHSQRRDLSVHCFQSVKPHLGTCSFPILIRWFYINLSWLRAKR